jgi:hypothetical protein
VLDAYTYWADLELRLIMPVCSESVRKHGAVSKIPEF